VVSYHRIPTARPFPTTPSPTVARTGPPSRRRWGVARSPRPALLLLALAGLLTFATTPVAFAGTLDITIDASAGPNGAIAPDGQVVVVIGQDQTFTITPDPCYQVAQVVVDAVPVGPVSSYTFALVQDNHSIAATFAPSSYTIAVATGGGGRISPVAAVTVPDVSEDFDGASLPAGWSSFKWPTGAGPGTTLVAGGTLTVSGTRANPDPYAAYPFRSMEFLAMFRAEPFQVAGFGAGNQLAPNLLFDVSPFAVFTTGAGGTGLIARVSNGGSPLDFAIPGSWLGTWHSYRVNWNVGSVDFFIDGSLMHSEPQTIAGAMRPGFSDLTVDGPGLAVDWVRVGPYAVACGESQSFTITADPCRQIAGVLVDGSPVGAVSSYTFSNVAANHTLAASFAPITYTIAATAGTGGSISPNGNVAVGCGTDQGFTVAADAGFLLTDVVVDGGSVGAQTSYSFTSVAGDHTISASFVVNAYTITASAGANGSITPSGAITVTSGGSAPFSIAPGTGYHVADVLVDGGSVGAVTSYTFTHVAANHTIAASFAADPQALPSLSIGNASSTEGNRGGKYLGFTVTLSAASTQTITVKYSTHDGTAKAADLDFKATTGVLTFLPGTLTRTLSVTIYGDTKVEADETFQLLLSKSTNATIAQGTGTGTIVNDDGLSAPQMSIGDVKKKEGNYGTTLFAFVVTLSGSSAVPVKVNFTTADITARASTGDYVAQGGTLTIPAGMMSATISIGVKGDRKKELDETFAVNLGSPTNATLRDGQGIGTILNDDGVFASPAASLPAGADSASLATDARGAEAESMAEPVARLSLAVGPNPMRDRLSVSFSLPADTDVRLTVLDLQGRAIESLADGRFAAGRHTLSLDAGRRGSGMPPGVYFLRLVTAERSIVQRFVRAQ
jgi:hypothetical protein